MSTITDVVGCHVLCPKLDDKNKRHEHSLDVVLASRGNQQKLQNFITSKKLNLTVDDFEKLQKEIKDQRDRNNEEAHPKNFGKIEDERILKRFVNTSDCLKKFYDDKAIQTELSLYARGTSDYSPNR